MIAASKSRLWDGKPLNAFGKVDKKRFGESREVKLTKDFARTKLSPSLGSVVNLYLGKDMVGEPATVTSEAQNLIAPMIVGDMKEVFEKDGTLGIAKTLPSVIGIGVSVYEEKQSFGKKE